jgi:cysteinyl-tRNA synthetase
LRWGLGLFGLGSLAETVAAPEAIVALAEQRKEARARRDFEEADRLRGEIEARGWEVRDIADGFELVPK